MTKDETFLLKLYQLAMKQGGPQESVNQYIIGQAMGENDKGIDTITRHLAQANFIKKSFCNDIYLTPQGLSLVDSLQRS